MKQIERIERSIAQRKRFVRGRRGLHTQMLINTRAIYTYLLEVNRLLTLSSPSDEDRLRLAEAGVELTKEVEQWLGSD